MSTSILLLGNYRQTLTVLRSLGRGQTRSLVLGTTGEGHYTEASRFVAAHWRHPPVLDEPEFFKEALLQLLQGHPEIRCLFPIGENEMRVLAEILPELPADVAVVMPSPAVTLTCFDKAAMYRLAEQLGIAVPRWLVLDTWSSPKKPDGAVTLAQIGQQLGFPCLFKANDSRFQFAGRKAIICRSVDELQVLLEHEGNSDAPGHVIGQAFIEGARINGSFVAQQGELVHYFEHVTLQEDCGDSTGYEVAAVSCAVDPQREADCRRIVTALGYHGVGCMQFLANQQGSIFLELNPRLDANVVLPVACGLPVPQLAVQLAEADRCMADVLPPFVVGRRLHWFTGDLRGILNRWRCGELGNWSCFSNLMRMTLTALRSPVHMHFSWDDPWPAVHRYVQFVPRMMRPQLTLPQRSLSPPTAIQTWPALEPVES